MFFFFVVVVADQVRVYDTKVQRRPVLDFKVGETAINRLIACRDERFSSPTLLLNISINCIFVFSRTSCEYLLIIQDTFLLLTRLVVFYAWIFALVRLRGVSK